MGYEEKRKQLLDEANALIEEGKLQEATAKMQEVKDLDAKHEEEAKARADFEALNAKVVAKQSGFTATGETVPSGKQSEAKDIFATEEYERVFMDHVQKNTPIPEKFQNAAAKSGVSDVSALIPTTLVKEIIREMKSYGNIYAKVRKLNIQGGVEVPILSLKPTASWVGEGASDDQKVQANTKVTFSYHGLECKIAMTLLASVVTLEEFKNEFIRLAVEAMAEAIDKAIINGTGSSQPLGITKDSRVPSANVITLTEEEISSWATWKKKVFAKMKKAYRKGEFIMAQGTFDSYVDGMVDTTGQPIGRVNYGIDGGESYRFGGKEVETVEADVIANFDDAAKGDVIAIFANLTDYAINSNMEMRTVRWSDHDTNQEKQKVMMIVDGKLLDPSGVLIIKKDVKTQTQPTG